MIRNSHITRESGRLSDANRPAGRELHGLRQEFRFDRFADHAADREARFFQEFYDSAMSIHGSVQTGWVTVILPPQRSKGTATFCGRALTTDSFAACLPRDPVALRTPDAYRCINFSVCSSRLDQAFRLLHQRGLDELIPQTAVRSAPVGFITRLRAEVGAILSGLAGHAGDGLPVEQVILALGDALTAGDPPPAIRLAARNHWRCVRTVRDFVEAHLGEALSIEALCQTACVSERTLTTAFREVLGVSPREFIKARRLNAAFHALSAEPGMDTSVKSVARSLGFTHMGYFARDYRMHFGEKPSVTLNAGGSWEKKCADPPRRGCDVGER